MNHLGDRATSIRNPKTGRGAVNLALPCASIRPASFFIEQSADFDAEIDGHDVDADGGGQIDSLILKKRITIVQFINIQVEERFDRRAGFNGDRVAIVILDGDVFENPSIAVAPE